MKHYIIYYICKLLQIFGAKIHFTIDIKTGSYIFWLSSETETQLSNNSIIHAPMRRKIYLG